MIHEVCLDANFFISCFTRERDHDLCLNLLSVLLERDYVFFEPALVGFEVASTLRKKVFLKEITKSEAEDALEIFSDFPLLLQWQTPVLSKSLTHANHLGTKNTYDMSYLAVAIDRNIACVTLDEDFMKKAKKVYKKMYSVCDYVARL